MTAPAEDQGRMITFDSVLQSREKDAGIVPPLSPDEQQLALSVARAYHYAFTLCEELPQRAGVRTVIPMAWLWGIHMVIERRAGRTWT